MGFASIAWARMWRRPAVAPVIAELRDQVSGRSRGDVPTHFERIVGRGIGRHVFMFEITPDGFRGLTETGCRAGVWIAKREHVRTCLRGAEPGQLPKRLTSAGDRIEAVLPIIRDGDVVVGMVAIGRRPLRRLSARERSLVEAAVGMAILLMQQAGLRQQVDVAQTVYANVQQIAASHRARIGIWSYLNSRRN
jgi:hypothetical protein